MSDVAQPAVVRLERQGAVAVLVVDRPKALNAINRQVLNELSEHVYALEADRDVRVVLLCGGGEKAFVAGADIAEMAEMMGEESADFARFGAAVFAQLEALPQPVIAVVQGFALGGGFELALACDFILASEKAKFGLPETALAVIPGFGGTQRLGRITGGNTARYWLLSGDMFSAEAAEKAGVVQQVLAPEALMPAALALAQKIASRGPLALAAAKRVAYQGAALPLDQAVELESEAFGQCFDTEDQKEGMAAFLARRPAVFLGK